jgi:hypothetical protein
VSHLPRYQEARQATAEWLHGLASWCLAITVTIASSDPITRRPSDRARLIRAVDYFISRLNKAAFGHAALRRQYRVASVYVIEHGVLGDHPHVHMTVSCPPHWGENELKAEATRLIDRNSLFRSQYAISPYFSSNWHDYTLKFGLDRIVVERMQTANH